MAITISGNGIVEANLADNAVTLAKMASGTDGEILTYDASGNPVAVSVGTDGQVLTSTGAGSPPAFETAAAGGKVLQVVSSGGFSATASTYSTSWVDTGHSVTITPQTGSKVLLLLGGGRAELPGGARAIRTTILRGGTTHLGHTTYGLSVHDTDSGRQDSPHSISHLDNSPGGNGSTAITYNVYFTSPDAGTVQYSYITGGRVELIAMEIGA